MSSSPARGSPHGAPAHALRPRTMAYDRVRTRGGRGNNSRSRIAAVATAFIAVYVLLDTDLLLTHNGNNDGWIRPAVSSLASNSSSLLLSEAVSEGGDRKYRSAAEAAGEQLLDGEKEFVSAAWSLSPVTDKVTTHSYHSMYGRFLLPYYDRMPGMKMLEIGLGCDMNYEPGASVALWGKLFPKADLWEAEYNSTCVELAMKQGKLDGFNILVGDQGNNKTLDGWIGKSGGNFDVIIDDGGHHNCQIMASFVKLWPTLKPGGLYFLEDLSVGKWMGYRRYSTASCSKTFIFTHKLKNWLDDLIYQGGYGSRKWDIHFMFCQAEACVLGKSLPEVETKGAVTTGLLPGERSFVSTAQSLAPVTDKVTTHSYHTMYGRFLLPYYRMNPGMKMLEIGLGCDMNYEPGASVALWKKLFPQAELWEAEYDAACVDIATKQGKLDGFNVLVGDQGNNETLDGWIDKSGGNFDVVIDDGGHHNCQIAASFAKLWPTLKPGGLYFIEDLSVGKWRGYRRYSTATCPKTFTFSHRLEEWLDDLIYQGGYGSHKWDIHFVFCQAEACVLGKKPPKVVKSY